MSEALCSSCEETLTKSDGAGALTFDSRKRMCARCSLMAVCSKCDSRFEGSGKQCQDCIELNECIRCQSQLNDERVGHWCFNCAQSSELIALLSSACMLISAIVQPGVYKYPDGTHGCGHIQRGNAESSRNDTKYGTITFCNRCYVKDYQSRH
jgi:hypothetical protein